MTNLYYAQEIHDHKAPPIDPLDWDDGPFGEVIVALDCDDLAIACDWTVGDFDAALGDLWIVDAMGRRTLELPASAVSLHLRVELQRLANAALESAMADLAERNEHDRLDRWDGS